MAYYRKSDNAKAQIVEHSPVTDSVYVQFADEPPQIITWNEFYKDILRGHLRTMDIWVKQGLIKI